ncbi:unnamed protein product [Dovyalis caffra]|uniref:Uncharacterized protein n=1 Tax=Dovyalis caffra TaxID=77055 RepID=A0AAV1RYU4_9ROSI|nr:unnamed protein product [Dovyalis caffra]
MSNPTRRTCEENKKFEMNWEYLIKGEWEKVALLLPEKSVDDIKQHYKHLLEDIELIDSGLVPHPSYSDNKNQEEQEISDDDDEKEEIEESKVH